MNNVFIADFKTFLAINYQMSIPGLSPITFTDGISYVWDIGNLSVGAGGVITDTVLGQLVVISNQ